MIKKIIFIFSICFFKIAFAQRVYTNNSVLATGSFVKLGIVQEGVYKIDAASFNALGLGNNVLSNSIKLFGNGGAMLEEKNNTNYIDDLQENAIEIFDGGDGLFNGTDYLLFYANGANKWAVDNSTNTFTHKKNLYTDTAYYFITTSSGNGKRIIPKNFVGTPNQTVTSFNHRFFNETDNINFLNSGKEWYGEEFSTIGGTNLTKNFNLDIPNIITTEPITITTNIICRSVGTASSFSVKANNNSIQNINIPAISGNFLDAFASVAIQQNTFSSLTPNLNLSITFNAGIPSAQGWLNWFSIQARRSLNTNNINQLLFRDFNSIGNNNIAEFSISNASTNTVVWDITNPLTPEKINTTFNNNQLKFINTASTLKEYISFSNTGFLIPTILGKLETQNLHNSSTVDYLIVTHPNFITQANRLAQFHKQQYNYKVLVATTNQIFNEFSGGNADPTAIKNFVKMYYDKAGIDTTKRPKYLLLFGAASFDFKNRISNNTNFVPCYESANSLDPLSSHTSDDFFGLLDDDDDVNMVSPVSLLDIGIGRIPCTTITEAKNMVDKIVNYHSKSSLGSWRNDAVFVADDKDNNIHLNDAEFMVANTTNADSTINTSKIYLDAFPLVSGSGGGRYPSVNNAIINHLFNGALFFNYSGHGGYIRLADEAIFGTEELSKLNNPFKLPLFITATCDFAPFDDPTKSSLGSAVLLGSTSGAIALMTTTRVVFSYSNRVINSNYLNLALQRQQNGNYLTLGEAVKKAKNYTYQTFNDVFNNRKFTLLGDPAMQLAFPKLDIILLNQNDQPISITDTLKAQQKCLFKGKIVDANGNLQTNFNGTAYPSVFDKIQNAKTLGNDAQSPITTFTQQTNLLYKGKVTVTNGLFQFEFVVPKDINYQIGKGKISVYAENGVEDASGVNKNILIGSSGIGNSLIDKTGPTIAAFLNDNKFVSGGITNENPLLLVHLFDSSGVNTVGTGIGHDITAIIDGDERNIIVLNDFYESQLNSFQIGQIKYQLPTLSPGLHTVRIKAWDVFNNSSEIVLQFMVAKQKILELGKVFNYPNPFVNSTTFSFEHNQPNENLSVTIDIFSATGSFVHQIKTNVQTAGSRNCEIFWDGKSKRSSEKLTSGVYLYRIIVLSNNGFATATKILSLFK